MKRRPIFSMFAILSFVLISFSLWSQFAPQVSGKIIGGDGQPVAGAQVVYTALGSGKTYKSKTDANGEFTQLGIGYGDYQVEVFSADGQALFKQKATVSGDPGSQRLLVDLSKTGAAGQPKMSKEQVEAIKAQNAKMMQMNTLIQQANNAMNARNWEEAIAPLQQLIADNPTQWLFYSALGIARLNLGQYEQAVESFENGIQAAESNTTVDPRDPNTDPSRKKAGMAKMLTNEGNAYLKLHKNNEALAAYTKAAALDPNPATAYFNLCATQYNTGNVEGALEACDKALAADPSKADAYYIKGSLLFAGSQTDKEGKLQAPPGTVEALNKYLELAPNGPHANDVKEMLKYIGSKVETTYQKKK